MYDKNSDKIKDKERINTADFPYIKRLLRENLLPRKKLFAIAIFWMIVGSAMTSVVAWLTRSIVDSVFLSNDRTLVWSTSLAIAAVFFIRGLSEYFTESTLAKFRSSMVASLIRQQFGLAIRQKLAVIRKSSPTHLAAMINRQSSSAAGAIMLISTNLVKNLLTLVGLGAVMIYQQPFLSLAAVIFSPFALWFLSRLNRKIKNYASNEISLEGNVISNMAEALDGAMVVKSFQIEQKVDANVAQAAKAMENRSVKLSRLVAAASPIMETMGGLGVVSVLIYASYVNVSSSQTPGALASFLTAFLLAYRPAKQMSGFNLRLSRLMRPVKGMFEFIDRSQLQSETVSGVQIAIPKTEMKGIPVVFDKVSFEYQKNMPALKMVSFSIEAGQRAALVGHSGAGKTTIANIMLGFNTEFQGEILLGEKSLRDISLDQLRRMISFVSQDTFLFDDTIKNNIAIGNPEASEAAIIEAARIAHILEFADTHPKKLDTKIGSGGIQLSGGQRQRIAIARAILKEAPIVIWDEATSALDGTTEELIEDMSLDSFAGKTLIVISHRMSTAQKADLVIQLEAGRVKAIGGHKSLMNSQAEYRRLWGGQLVS